ncbi:hypothetical protein [Listeria grandensis]|uniref:DUF5082 domain-containing protein n=1 Tax=Listeria grandensis TaxID=1494963 RepID=A0A7X0Y444_9LIST|nr:hypothetical protein [Listeria grandensis]MBC1936642.1 hypothetical protein [Listeria grandensis]MBC6314289.1 hypothetical protein [Listeria grandensis]
MAANDAELLERINRNKEKRKKYKAVIKVIDSNRLNQSRSSDMSSTESFVDSNREKVQTMEMTNAYDYLDTLSSKLKTDLKDIDTYIDFAKDSIKSIQDLHETLESKKRSLDDKISDDVDKYNDGKMLWERELKGDGLFG